MDLLGETSSETRVLAARHISAEKTFPETNNAINTTFLCYDNSVLPDVGSYLAALGSYAWVIWTCGILILLVICGLYVATIRSARKNWDFCITNVVILVAVYPVITATAVVAVVVPRAMLISEAIAQQAVMIALYHFFCMIIAECGGEEKLVRLAGESRWKTRVLPCCCWPCCVLPEPPVQKRNIRWVRYLILQIPVIQALIYITILILWAEDPMLYFNYFTFVQPFVAISIISGMWGIIMCLRTVEMLGIKPRPRFLVIQLALLMIKVQGGMVRSMTGLFNMPCVMSLHPSVFLNMIQNCVIILEMLLLSIWAYRVYSTPPGKVVDRVQHAVVAVVDDTFVAFDEKAIKEGIENKSFKYRHDM